MNRVRIASPTHDHGIKVLGLDPGTRNFGWGVVKRVGTRLVHVAHGTIAVGSETSLGKRLVAIEQALNEIVTTHAPDEASIESLFFAKDAQAAAKLGHARGVALLVCARAGLTAFEVAPTRVKRTIVGIGRADKAQVAQMIRVLLGLPDVPRPDAADALAVAVTHLQGRAFLAAKVAAKPLSI
ncbi:MAG: crossover junction endodeoxyribonuclease RuvC [Polyangiaceae bacterium]|nr:crossover junction endodeoxyribonuclease RuvC [Polyangiaceae bacterium]